MIGSITSAGLLNIQALHASYIYIYIYIYHDHNLEAGDCRAMINRTLHVNFRSPP
jgi:hypothetical protein